MRVTLLARSSAVGLGALLCLVGGCSSKNGSSSTQNVATDPLGANPNQPRFNAETWVRNVQLAVVAVVHCPAWHIRATSLAATQVSVFLFVTP